MRECYWGYEAFERRIGWYELLLLRLTIFTWPSVVTVMQGDKTPDPYVQTT